MGKTFACIKCGHENKPEAKMQKISALDLKQSDIGSFIKLRYGSGLITSFRPRKDKDQEGILMVIDVFDPTADRMREPDTTSYNLREHDLMIEVWR